MGTNAICRFEGRSKVALFGFGNDPIEIDAFRWKYNRRGTTGEGNRGHARPRNTIGQNSCGYLCATLEGDSALDRIFQFPDVAGPIVGLQPVHGLRGDTFDGFPHGLAETLEKMPSEERNVLTALAK